MPNWQPNLILHTVPPPALRKSIYLAMAAYLVVCGIVTVWVLHQSALRLMDAVHERTEIRALEESFRRLYNEPEGTLAEVTRRVDAELEETQAALSIVRKLVERRVVLPRLLAGLVHPLPSDVQLVRVDLNRSRGSLEFDLAMPDAPDRELAHARSLVDAWNASPVLAGQVEDIRIVARNTQRLGDQAIVVLRLEGRLTARKD
jgi:hypothetical protein